MRLIGGPIVLVVAGVAACAAFGEGKSGDPPPSTDGGPTSTEAGTTTDGDVPDADLPPVDSVCPMNALLCEKFDDGLTQWQGASDPAFRIESLQGNNVLKVKVGRLSEGVGRDVTITRDLPGTMKGVRLTFDFRVAKPAFVSEGGSSNYAIVRVENGGGGSQVFAALYLANGGADTYTQLTVDTESGIRETKQGTTTYGVWHTGVVELRLGDPGSLAYRIDGGETASQSMVTDPLLELAVSLGVFRPNQDTPPIAVDFDDIIAEAL